MKEFITRSVDSKWLVENSKEMLEIKEEFEKSILQIKSNIEQLSEKEVDFSPILKEFVEISQKIQENRKDIIDLNDENSIQLQDQYKKSMKYIIYIAKNINNIGKQDLLEIKQTLLHIKK
jgi:hypothetical protein